MLKSDYKNKNPKEERAELWCKGCETYYPRNHFSTEGKTSAGRIKYRSRCKSCWKKHASTKNWDQQQRIQLVLEHKHKCLVCGYDKYKGALDFHHIDGTTKLFGIAEATRINYRKFTDKEVLTEINKCVVLCNRCHKEYHAGLITLPHEKSEIPY